MNINKIIHIQLRRNHLRRRGGGGQEKLLPTRCVSFRFPLRTISGGVLPSYLIAWPGGHDNITDGPG